MNPLGRRDWLRAGLGLVGLGLLSACGALPATRPARVPRLGWLSPVNGPGSREFEAVREGLRDLGHVEGQTVTIEYRLTEGRNDRMPALAAELVELGVDVIVTDGLAAALAARDATHTIPIVMGIITDPVGSGLVASLGHPGGNISGFASLAPGFYAKRLQLFAEAVPNLSRVAVLRDPTTPPSSLSDTQAAAADLRCELLLFETRTADDLEVAFLDAADAHVDGLVTLGGPLQAQLRRPLVALAVEHRLPGMFGDRDYVVEGGLMAYSSNTTDIFRRSASYVDKVLKGANPGDLPVQQPTTFDLVVNLGAARALGLTLPRSLLLQATEVVP